MECAETKELLSEYIDGILDRETRGLVEEHLRTCKDCREELASLRAVVKELGSLEPVGAPADFLDRVHERIERPSRSSRILRALFVPTRIKIPFQLATAAATAVLVFSLFNLMQPAKQMVGVPSDSRPISSAKKPAADSAEPTPEKGIYESKPLLKEAALPQKFTEKKPIELVLLLKGEMIGAAHAPRVPTEVPADEDKVRPVEKERARAGEVSTKKLARQAAPKARLSAHWHEGEQRSQPMPDEESRGAKDDAPRATVHFGEAPSKIIKVIELVDGEVIGEVYEGEPGRPQSITAQIPAKNYTSFLDKLGRLGTLQSPFPTISAQDQDMIQIRIRLISRP
jgi:anti-sigma factor RsiW